MRAVPARMVLSTMVMILVVAGWAGSGLAQEAVHQVVPATATGVVEIENLAGSVVVTGWSREEVEISGTLGRGAERLEVDSDGGRVHIEVKNRRDGHRSGRDLQGTRLEIKIPASSRLKVETVSASISASGLDGALDLESVSGEIEVGDRPGELDVASVSGRVRIAVAPDDCEVASVSGDIEVLQASGDLEASNVSGDIMITGGSMGRAALETVSGSIRCEAEPTGRGSVELESMSGTVTLVVSGGLAADFELASFSGDIVNQLGSEAQRKSGHGPGKEVKLTTGSGGPRIKLSSFSGTVKLLRR